MARLTPILHIVLEPARDVGGHPRQSLDLVGDDAEALAGVAGPRRLDERIVRQQLPIASVMSRIERGVAAPVSAVNLSATDGFIDTGPDWSICETPFGHRVDLRVKFRRGRDNQD